jgi:hypothetical protein
MKTQCYAILRTPKRGAEIFRIGPSLLTADVIAARQCVVI